MLMSEPLYQSKQKIQMPCLNLTEKSERLFHFHWLAQVSFLKNSATHGSGMHGAAHFVGFGRLWVDRISIFENTWLGVYKALETGSKVDLR